MAAPINLNKVRKAKLRAAAAQRAGENRAKHGRTKAQKQIEATRREKAAKAGDASKLRNDPPD